MAIPDYYNNLYISFLPINIEKARDALRGNPFNVAYRVTQFGNRVLRLTYLESLDLECMIEVGLPDSELRLNGGIDLEDHECRNHVKLITERLKQSGFSGSFELYDESERLLASGRW